MAKVVIYTDGSSSGNPGPGGYGVVLISGVHRKELSQGYTLTTNNRMELMAVIAGLEALKTDGCEVTVYSDSKYVVDAVEKRWVFGWAATPDFKGKKNPDLWSRFLKAYRRHTVRFVWIKGHDDNPHNERCDRLAVAAGKGKNLLIDKGYVQEMASRQAQMYE
ncbi:MAG: ribonuclease HI [Prevotellaceae bacterium]|nr:ribonuclease HI [Prevotellaceae bacterium]